MEGHMDCELNLILYLNLNVSLKSTSVIVILGYFQAAFYLTRHKNSCYNYHYEPVK